MNGTTKGIELETEVIIEKLDRSRDRIIIKEGERIVKEIPAVVFDEEEAVRLQELVDDN